MAYCNLNITFEFRASLDVALQAISRLGPAANSETSYEISHKPITVAPSEGRVAGCGFYTPNSSSKFYTLSTLIMSV